MKNRNLLIIGGIVAAISVVICGCCFLVGIVVSQSKSIPESTATPVSPTDIFDPIVDFSGTTNNNMSTWSYRFSNDLVRDGSYSLLPFGESICDTGTITWREATFFGVGVNRTGNDIECPFSVPITWPNNTIWLHPDGLQNPPPGAGLAVLSWLAPADGTVDVSYEFADMDPNGGDGVDWFIDLGDASGNLAFGTIDSLSTEPQQINNITVTVGDRINFVVSPRASQDHRFDSTQLMTTINFTPSSIEVR